MLHAIDKGFLILFCKKEYSFFTVILVAAVFALLATAPVAYDFANADAPRHALNGAFVLDALRATRSWHNPISYAAAYYARYPSLSIGFYPPLFYVAEAAVFAVLGVSHVAAQATVALFTLLLAGAAYRLARMILPRWPALGATLLLLGMPEMALWARQVMLDVPAQAMLMLCVLCFARHLRRGKGRDLWCAALALEAALYIKLSAGFIVVPLAAALVAARGWQALLDRRLWLAGVVMALLALPALWLTWRFAAVNLDNVAGQVAGPALFSVSRWAFYLKVLPRQVGWLTVILAVPGSYFLRRQARDGAGKWFAVLLAGWAGVGYLVFSGIRVHETRHDLMLMFPVALAATAGILGLLRDRLPKLAAPACVAFGAGTLLWSLATPVPRIAGYAQIADRVASVAPPHAIVLLSVFRDGNFVFAMRARGNRPDISIVRANKWLLRFMVDRKWGVGQSGYDRNGLIAALHDHGVAVAVEQRGFWDDLKQMALLEEILRDPSLYRSAAVVAIRGDLSADDRGALDPPCANCRENNIDVLLPVAPAAADPVPIALDLPFLGGRIK